MPYVYSTFSRDMGYAIYKADAANDINQVERIITINGKVNVATKKHIITPRGAVTSITVDEARELEKNIHFVKHQKAGHITMSSYSGDAEEVAKADLLPGDNAAPLEPGDFPEGGAPRTEVEGEQDTPSEKSTRQKRKG